MAQKKETQKKSDVKVQDLAPKKDAKGGRSRSVSGNMNADANADLNASANRGSLNTQNLD